MTSILVTHYTTIVSKKNVRWNVLHTVNKKTGETKVEWLDDAKFQTLYFDPKMLSEPSNGKWVDVSADYDQKGAISGITLQGKK